MVNIYGAHAIYIYVSYVTLSLQNNNEQNNLSLLEVHYIIGEKESKEVVINQRVSAVIRKHSWMLTFAWVVGGNIVL